MADAFSDGQTFTIAEAAEALRPHINPMVAARAANWRRKTEGRATSWEAYETRRLDDVTAGLRAMAWNRIRTKLRCSRSTVERVGPGQYRLLRADA